MPSDADPEAKTMDDLNLNNVIARLERVEKEKPPNEAIRSSLSACGRLCVGNRASQPCCPHSPGGEFCAARCGRGNRAELVLEAARQGRNLAPSSAFSTRRMTKPWLSPTRLELAGKSDLGPDIIPDDAKGTPRMDLGLEHTMPFILLNDEKAIIRVDMGFGARRTGSGY